MEDCLNDTGNGQCNSERLAGDASRLKFANLTLAANLRGRHVTDDAGAGPLDEEKRKAIFLALVTIQDKGHKPARARHIIAEQFGIGEDQVRRIEDEGVDKDWPPL